MYAPLLMRGDEIENDLFFAVRLAVDDRLYGLDIDRRTVNAEPLPECPHPQMILVQLLPPAKRSPGDQLVHVGVAGVVADLFRLQPGPRRRRNYFSRLGNDVAKADLFILF